MARKAARAALRAAIQAADDYQDVTILRSFGASIDVTQLPAVSVVTQIEQIRRVSADTVARVATVEIGLRRAGGEHLEDLLDDDAEALERIGLPVLQGINSQAELSTIRTEISGEGAQRVGTLVLEFSLPRHTTEGAPD